MTMKRAPSIPSAPHSIQKGSSLKDLLGHRSIECLAENIQIVYPKFRANEFKKTAKDSIAPLAILQRGHHLAHALRKHLPENYSDAVGILVDSLTPPLTKTDEFGLSGFFYLPHVCFVANYGLDPEHNGGLDPFKISMKAQYDLLVASALSFQSATFSFAGQVAL